jgi:hypothetical protein
MRRDLNLLRAIVLQIEDHPEGWAPRNVLVEGYTPAQIEYYEHLLVDAGLAHGSDTSHTGSTGPSVLITHLTWEGHEFAEAARNGTRWNNAMDIVKKKGGSITIEILTRLLFKLMKGTFGLS